MFFNSSYSQASMWGVAGCWSVSFLVFKHVLTNITQYTEKWWNQLQRQTEIYIFLDFHNIWNANNLDLSDQTLLSRYLYIVFSSHFVAIVKQQQLKCKHQAQDTNPQRFRSGKHTLTPVWLNVGVYPVLPDRSLWLFTHTAGNQWPTSPVAVVEVVAGPW